MNWDNPEPNGYGGSHTGVVGHFTCLVWIDSSIQGFGYAYNDVTREINVNQDVQNTCNYIGDFAANVKPKLEGVSTAAPSTFDFDALVARANSAARTSSQVGTIVSVLIMVLVSLHFVWCQHPFLMDEMEKWSQSKEKPQMTMSQPVYMKGQDCLGKSVS